MSQGVTTRIVRSVLPLALAATLAIAGSSEAAKFGSRPLRPGMHGKDIRFLQRALTTLGFATGIDGSYGKGTYRSVKKLETQKRWPVDGRVSKKDAKRIAGLIGRRTAGPTGLYYAFGLNLPTLTLTSQKAGQARVEVSGDASGVVQSIPVSFDGPGAQDVGWSGLTSAGAYAGEDTYRMKLADPGSARASVTGGQTGDFLFRWHAFPVVGDHSFGGAASRFGAPRAGHTHQGQDVAAACGQALVVVEGGVLRVNAYQATGAGYYVVVHGALSGSDYVYMHLKAPSWAAANTTVYAGQVIGKVGATGDAQGCHLHFEHWSAPGWYVGGGPMDPLPELLAWDTWS
jgi:murein DD-endopeptidase MepM/ murein hydrolase activator NlpD